MRTALGQRIIWGPSQSSLLRFNPTSRAELYVKLMGSAAAAYAAANASAGQGRHNIAWWNREMSPWIGHLGKERDMGTTPKGGLTKNLCLHGKVGHG